MFFAPSMLLHKETCQSATQETAALARRFDNAQILKRIRLLEEFRDHLGRNIHESLAIEVAFLAIFMV